MDTMTFQTAAEAASGWEWGGWEAIGALATTAATIVALGLPWWERRRARKLAELVAGRAVSEEFRHVANSADRARAVVNTQLNAPSRQIQNGLWDHPPALNRDHLVDFADASFPVFQSHQGIIMAGYPNIGSDLSDAQAEMARKIREFKDAYAELKTMPEENSNLSHQHPQKSQRKQELLKEMLASADTVLARGRFACTSARSLNNMGEVEEWKPRADQVSERS